MDDRLVGMSKSREAAMKRTEELKKNAALEAAKEKLKQDEIAKRKLQKRQLELSRKAEVDVDKWQQTSELNCSSLSRY
jgi:hypothetical protein